MILKDLLKQVDIDEIIEYINSHYADEIKFEEDYRQLYLSLLDIDPITDPDMVLFVVEQKDYLDDGSSFLDVSGYHKRDNQKYALDFTDRKEWMGMNTSDMAIKIYGSVPFVSECLREMTFISFDEDVVKNELNNLKETYKRVKEGEEELISSEGFSDNLIRFKEKTEQEKEEERIKFERIQKWNDDKFKELNI